MMTYAELEAFFTGLVATAQGRGITCGITSDMACAHFGVAATTKDCDVLCVADSAQDFLELIAETQVLGKAPVYRGNLSPPPRRPLAARRLDRALHLEGAAR